MLFKLKYKASKFLSKFSKNSLGEFSRAVLFKKYTFGDFSFVANFSSVFFLITCCWFVWGIGSSLWILNNENPNFSLLNSEKEHFLDKINNLKKKKQQKANFANNPCICEFVEKSRYYGLRLAKYDYNFDKLDLVLSGDFFKLMDFFECFSSQNTQCSLSKCTIKRGEKRGNIDCSMKFLFNN